MRQWLRHLRGALGMGVTWALAWAAGGLAIGAASVLLPWLPWDRFFRVFDAPLPALAIPGFIGGTLFSTVLGIAGRGRSIDEISVGRVAAWGAVGGLLLSLVPAALVLVGLATITAGGAGVWGLTLMIAPPLIALGAASASGTLLLARRRDQRALPR